MPQFEIIETTCKVVEADNIEEVREKYMNCKIVLTADDFQDYQINPL